MSFWSRQTSTSRACALPDTHFMRDEDKNGPNESLCNMRKYNCLWDGETSGYGGGGAGGGSDDAGGTFLFFYWNQFAQSDKQTLNFVLCEWTDYFFTRSERKRKRKKLLFTVNSMRAPLRWNRYLNIQLNFDQIIRSTKWKLRRWLRAHFHAVNIQCIFQVQ